MCVVPQIGRIKREIIAVFALTHMVHSLSLLSIFRMSISRTESKNSVCINHSRPIPLITEIG